MSLNYIYDPSEITEEATINDCLAKGFTYDLSGAIINSSIKHVGVAVLDSSTIIVCYENNSDNGYPYVLAAEIDGDNNITLGDGPLRITNSFDIRKVSRGHKLSATEDFNKAELLYAGRELGRASLGYGQGFRRRSSLDLRVEVTGPSLRAIPRRRTQAPATPLGGSSERRRGRCPRPA